ncbi:WD repeat domain-containing protein [Rutstroemia sp. NJR-2017a WRK4]|nr:WD repeat domain-containing protein [Rutstroemia sp. NJR-2017a WRK4]
MDKAWLDSLSEDWVSEPRSDSPEPDLPSLSHGTGTSDASSTRPNPSRIPKYNPQTQLWSNPPDSNPLSERSLNENNIPLSQRAHQPSKLRVELPSSPTVQHKSLRGSPEKISHETPEWKKRLLRGDVAYGEQRDLFSAAGLESIFQPPNSDVPPKKPSNIPESSVMPSSPPIYRIGSATRQFDDSQLASDDQPVQDNGDRPARGMKYRMVDDFGSEFSANDLSRGSDFRPNEANTRSPVKNLAPPSDPLSTSNGSTKNGYLDVGRVISGQSDSRNEGLSPIYMTRLNTIGSQAGFTALDISPSELQERLEQLHAEDAPVEGIDEGANTSQILPADVTTDTDELKNNGRFVSYRRGGSSQEGSFQRRMLSPSSLPPIDESALSMGEVSEIDARNQLPRIRKTRASNDFLDPRSAARPILTHTPQTSPTKSGSPLKLFGTYDTFTSQKLLRRLSQYEERSSDHEEEVPPNTALDSPYREMNDSSAVRPKSENRRPLRIQTSKRYTSFGAGDLDAFRFSEDVSLDSNPGNEAPPHMELPVLDPKSQTKFRFRLDSSPVIKEGVVASHRMRSTSSASSTGTTKHNLSMRKKRPGTGSSVGSAFYPSSQLLENLKTPRKDNGDAEGKRLPRSPLKDPTPKRRRTLHRADSSLLEAPSPETEHRAGPPSSERKRKTAKASDVAQASHPQTLEVHQAARPRTPTPSQRSSEQRDESPFDEPSPEWKESTQSQREKKIAMVQAELDSFNSDRALGASQQSSDSRKPSVTTQDFLDEAKKIMAGIRGKARPRSGLTSLEESQSDFGLGIFADSPTDEESEDSCQESTQEPFSRPPSRDGAPVSRTPLTQQDPKLLDHLRQYEEKSELDGLIASSIKSIAMAKDAARTNREVDRILNETISKTTGRLFDMRNDFQSEPVNIRLSQNPDRKRKHSGSTEQTDDDFQDIGFSSQGSNASIPTISSRGSDSRRVIAPHTVSHLIPEQLAGMVFDRERNIWVKKKPVGGDSDGPNFSPSDDTDDDPFEDIPDLSVDETQELMRLRAVAAKRKEDARLARYLDEEGQQDGMNERTKPHQTPPIDVPTVDVRPQTAPAKPTRRTSNDSPEAKVRSVSVGTNSTREPKKSRNRNINTTVKADDSSVKSGSQKATIEDEDQRMPTQDVMGTATPLRPRNVTITFSSPIAEVIEAPSYADEDSYARDDAYHSDYESFDESESDIIPVKKGKAKQRAGTRSTFRTTTRKKSVGGEQFMPRPVSRIDEQDEESFMRENNGAKRADTLVAAPPRIRQRETSVVLATPRPTHEIGTLELTPLSEFTMHQADESFGLNVSYVSKGKRQASDSSDGKKTLSHSIRELVEKLTEVEPYEPFWEHMKEARLKDKKLTSLHKLDEFCSHLENLEVSNNQISQLNGAPSTLRNLIITNNQLSDITAWGHLWNLQDVDVSNNEIESLSCFSNLVHLRTLKADNNKVTSTHGIGSLDGLIELRLRGNPIETLDLGGTKLKRLERLDLKNCQLKEVKSLGHLKRLAVLELQNNKLSDFLDSDDDACWAQQINLTGNNLESFDAGKTPQLRLLYLDGNRIKTITGLRNKRHLDSLSVREQQPGTVMDTAFLADAFEVRKLYLSGNFLGTWKPSVEFLNLQYLELANCGITSLPDDFGLMVSNVRVLNLNFNALKEFQCLLGIVRLQKLLIAGNRLCKVERLTRTLTAFPHLTTVDMRNNHVNHGFYPIAAERQLIKDGGFEKDEQSVNDPYTLGNADPARDAHYSNCLDMSTRMMRRVYEIMVFGVKKDNPRLKKLDGLPVNRSVLEIRDDVWDKLVEAKIAKDPNASKAEESSGREDAEKETENVVIPDAKNAKSSKETKKAPPSTSPKPPDVEQTEPPKDIRAELEADLEVFNARFAAIKLKQEAFHRKWDEDEARFTKMRKARQELKRGDGKRKSPQKSPPKSVAQNENKAGETKQKSPRQVSSIRQSTGDKPRKRVEFAKEGRWPAEDSFA